MSAFSESKQCIAQIAMTQVADAVVTVSTNGAKMVDVDVCGICAFILTAEHALNLAAQLTQQAQLIKAGKKAKP